MTVTDLLDLGLALGVGSYCLTGWNRRLGGLFLEARVQEKDWNYSEAARASGIDAKTIKKIEAGEINVTIESIELYAAAFGRSGEQFFRRALLEAEALARIDDPQNAKRKGGR